MRASFVGMDIWIVSYTSRGSVSLVVCLAGADEEGSWVMSNECHVIYHHSLGARLRVDPAARELARFLDQM